MSYVGVLTTSNIPGWECEITLLQGPAAVVVTGYTIGQAVAAAIDQLRKEAQRAGGNFVLGVGFSHQQVKNITITLGWGTIVRATPAPPIGD